MSRKKAVIYARVSTVKQADEGISVDDQIELSHKKAHELKATVLKVFRDDGISGRSALKRPAFQNAIDYCGLNEIDYLIVWNTSRFARNKIDAASYKKILKDSGTQVVYVSINIDSETDEGWFSESLLEIMDEHYSRQISKDTKRSMLKNARDGFFNGGNVPYGYQSVPAGARKKLAIKPEEAVIVKQIFRYYLCGDGCVIIALRLNKNGVLYKGRNWTKILVSGILKNPVYAGYIVFNRLGPGRTANPKSEWIMTKSHEEIVSDYDYNKVQETFESRTHGDLGSAVSSFVFTGILRCGYCGSSLQTENAWSRTKTIYYYYNCSKAKKGGGCHHQRRNAEKLDAWLLDSVLKDMLAPWRIVDFVQEVETLGSQWLKDRELKIEAATIELKKIKNSQAKIMEVIQEYGGSSPNLGTMLSTLDDLALDEDKLTRKLQELNSVDDYQPIRQDDILRATETLKTLIRETKDPKIVRTLMQSFIDKIVLKDGEAELFFKPSKLFDQHAAANEKSYDPKMVRSSKIWLPDLDSNQGPAD